MEENHSEGSTFRIFSFSLGNSLHRPLVWEGWRKTPASHTLNWWCVTRWNTKKQLSLLSLLFVYANDPDKRTQMHVHAAKQTCRSAEQGRANSSGQVEVLLNLILKVLMDVANRQANIILLCLSVQVMFLHVYFHSLFNFLQILSNVICPFPSIE